MTSAPPADAPSPDSPDPDPAGRAAPARRDRPAGRRAVRCRIVVGGRSGPRSRVWTVTAVGPDVVVAAEGETGAATRTVHRAGRRIVLPAPAVPAPGAPFRTPAAVQSPAPGWEAGAVLVVGLPALCLPAGVAVPDGTRRIAPPPPGHHVQVVLLFGAAAAPPLRLPSRWDAGGLRPADGGRLQLWSHHVPNGPRPDARGGTPDPWAGDDDGVPVVVDPGAG